MKSFARSMTRTSTRFKFQPPPDCGESNEGERLAYRSPKGETLSISTAAVKGVGELRTEQEATNKLLQNALTSVKAAVTQPDLNIVGELKLDERVRHLNCWTIKAETVDQKEIFFQSVFQNEMGVLLVTFEAYNTPVAKASYEEFIKSVAANNPAPRL